jgi:hypothetical protein
MLLGCLFALLAATFPRLGLLIIWIFTNWVQRAFNGNWFLPLLGLIFLPFTTLMFVLVDVAQPVGHVGLAGWLLVGLGFLFDLSHWAQIVANRQNGQQLYQQYAPARAPTPQA